MRITTLAVAALLSFSSAAQIPPESSASAPDTAGVTWKKMISTDLNNGIHGYINSETHGPITTPHGTFMFAEVLLTSDNVIPFINHGITYQTRSTVRIILADCEQEFIMVRGDLYFAEEFPNKKSSPLTGVRFGISNISRLPKTSDLYKNLCPTFHPDLKDKT